MFGKAPDGAPSVEGKMGGTQGLGASAAPSCGIAGNMYQIVEMTGLDGKKLLKLLPVSGTLGNAGPSINAPVLSDNTKVNASVSDLVSLKTVFPKSMTVLSNTMTSPPVTIPAPLTEAPGILILPKTLDNMELVKVTPIANENQTINSSSIIQNNYVSADKLSLQKDAPSVSSVKSNILVNTQNLPVWTSSVLPSGHHLQTHSYAKVKSVPASCLSPAIQHKILPVAATNASVTPEDAKPPNVIYVSQVNIMKTPISKCMQNINPTPAAEVVKPVVLTFAQTAAGNSVPDTLYNNQKPREGPMKWVVQENPESSASCLVPVRSSNVMVSNILKTLVDRKNAQNNPASALPACSSNLSESQTKLSSLKDNALVMYNGKVFLLARKGSNTDSAPDDRQVSATADTDFGKHTSQVTSLDGGNTITNQVVNLVLSKNKGVALSAKDPKSSENVKLPLLSEWNKTLKVASSLTSPHGNLQIGSSSQQKAVSTSENTPVGMKVDNKTMTEEDLNVNIIPTTLALQSSMSDVSKEEEQKSEKINSTGMTFQIEQKKVPHRKQYAEMRNKFGLLKEERVYLTRLSLFNSVIKTEETEWSSNVHTDDSCKLLQTITEEPDPEEEEMILGKQESNVKRKTELPEPVQENSKRRKTLGSSLDCDDSNLVTDNPSSFCRQVISQQENPTDSLPFSSNGGSDPNTCMQSNEDSEVLCSTLHNIENETTFSASSVRQDSFLCSPPDLEEIIKDEKIERLKLLLKKQEVALEEMRKKLQES